MEKRGIHLSQVFSFSGRIGRGIWWGTQIASVVFLLVALGAIGALDSTQDTSTSAYRYADTDDGLSGLAILMIVVAYVLFAWLNLAASVKRYHDLNKSGTWVLISFVPFIGGLWMLIECGFISGTPGPNQYGWEP